eukprot:2914473-Prymnesium_polylepis.1
MRRQRRMSDRIMTDDITSKIHYLETPEDSANLLCCGCRVGKNQGEGDDPRPVKQDKSESEPLGCKWHYIGGSTPGMGRELTNKKLSEALAAETLSAFMWDDIGPVPPIGHRELLNPEDLKPGGKAALATVALNYGDFVKWDTSYFELSGKVFSEGEWLDFGIADLHANDFIRSATSGLAWEEVPRRPAMPNLLESPDAQELQNEKLSDALKNRTKFAQS